MAKKFGGAKQKCMQRIRWRLQTFKLSTLLSIFFRSNLQMGKAKEGSGVGEEVQNGDLADIRREKGEKEEGRNQPSVAGEEQQRMDRWNHLLPLHYHHLLQQHHHRRLSSNSKLSLDDDCNLYEQVWMPAGHYLPHHSNSCHSFCLDPSLLVTKQSTPNNDVN